MDEAFIDASLWIAVAYPQGANHETGRVFWSAILLSKRSAVTTNWTLYEALTFLNSRGRHDLALKALRLAEQETTIVNAAEFEAEALNIFRGHADKRWSVVDCANFVCIKRRGSRWALSFDSDFAQAQVEFGFTLLGPGTLS